MILCQRDPEGVQTRRCGKGKGIDRRKRAARDLLQTLFQRKKPVKTGG
jgi:hypothetical protein